MLFKERGYKAASSDRDWSLSPQNTWLTSPPNGNNFFNWINFKWIFFRNFFEKFFEIFDKNLQHSLTTRERVDWFVCPLKHFPQNGRLSCHRSTFSLFGSRRWLGRGNFFFSAGYANFGSRPDRVIWCDSPFTGQSSERYANGREIVRFHLIESSDFGAPHLHFHRPLPPQLTAFDSPWTALTQDFWLGFDLINSLSATFNQKFKLIWLLQRLFMNFVLNFFCFKQIWWNYTSFDSFLNVLQIIFWV